MSHRNQKQLVQAVDCLYFTWHQEQPTTACIFVVDECLAIPPPPTRWMRSSFSDRCMFLRRGKGDVGISQQMSCWGEVTGSTLVSAAASSGSRRVKSRARLVHRAQPGSSRTRLRPPWWVCTVLYLRWLLQRMVEPLLLISVEWRLVIGGKHYRNGSSSREKNSLTKKGTDEENPQRHIDDRWGDVDEPVG